MKTPLIKTRKLIFIAIICIFFLFDIYKSDRTTLEIRDSQGFIEHEEVRLEPKSVVKHKFYNDDDILTITGRICMANDTDSILRDCFDKFENYNYEWVSINLIIFNYPLFRLFLRTI
jgi:hypothetical protein